MRLGWRGTTARTMAGLLSFDETQTDRCRRRREAIAEVRQLDAVYRGELDRYRVACRRLLALLIRAPLQVTYSYWKTSDKLLERRDQLKDYQRGIAAGNGRLRLDFKLVTRWEAATRLVAKHDPEFLKRRTNSDRKAIVERAVAILENEVSRVDARIGLLEKTRAAIVTAAQAVTAHIHEAARMSLVDPNAPAVVQWETLMDDCFPGAIVLARVPKATRQAAKSYVWELLNKHPLGNVFERVASQVYADMETNLPAVLRRRKRESLKVAAGELSTGLDEWCAHLPARACNRIATAILGLRFSFMSARQRLGYLSAHDQARYERELAAALPSEVLSALESLVREGLLASEDSDLFHYTPSIGRPFRKLAAMRT
jgi:hypothetical protein